MKKGSRKNKETEKITGIIKITSKPMGFVMTENESEDVIVFEENLNCALDKDEVEVEIVGRDRSRKKGRVVRIIKRNKTRFVGTLENKGKSLVFVPDDFKVYRQVDIFDFPKNLKAGTKIFVEINWTNPNLNPRGKIISIVGKKGENDTEMQSILLDKGIIYDFPVEVEQEAKRIFEEWKTVSFSFQKLERRDFRNILTFTIDPADAKDFDDAISYEELDGDKIRVGVHIADVSYFVRSGGMLDKEARERAFSTYLVDRTIPMLPEILSNNLCSLKPNEDRLAFSAVFDIKKKTGEILNRWFGKTVINSNKRFSYEEAQKIVDSSQHPVTREKEKLSEKVLEKSLVEPCNRRPEDFSERSFFGQLSNALVELDRIAKIYREENKKNGAIEFETDEVKFELDNQGKPTRVYKKSRLDTMKMIEEWMLLANREVAKFISDKIGKRGGTSIFRVHDLPNMEKIEELAIFVRALGHDLQIKKGEVTAKDLNLLLSQIEGHSAESLIKTAAIRSMAKAVYSTKNIGHFGLAFEYYTHFTSPIRRYPDLLVHRILEKYLNNEPISKNEFSKIEKVAKEASEKEITIAEAERDSIKYKQVEFMQSRIGQILDCVVSGVTEWGMYVEDPETKAEGLVKIRDMEDDYYSLDQKNYCLVGSHTKNKYSLGDNVRVKLVSADLNRKVLDFKLV